jgi:hypothetical protein
MVKISDWEGHIGRRLKLRDLHVFFAVVQSGSMGKAAAHLRVSPPAVSQIIADLEHALGVSLFDRSSQGVEPTSYGRALLKGGAAAFDDLTRSGRLRDVEHGPEQSPRPAEIRSGYFIPAAEYIQANRYRMRVMQQMDEAMSGLDLFIGANQLLTNRTGHPVISLPNGFFEGSPTALQLTGKLFGEPELLLLAHAFQSRTVHHLKHPSL